MVAVASRSEYLKVVEGCAGLVDLKSEVGTLLVNDRVLCINEMLVVEVGDDLVSNELHCHDVPFVRLEVVCAFTVPHGKPRPAGVLRGLEEEVIPPSVQDRVVVSGRTRYQSDVPGSVEPEFEPDQGVFEMGFLVKEPLVLTGNPVSSKDAILHFPLFLKKPFVADLSFREMLPEMKIAGEVSKGREGMRAPVRSRQATNLRWSSFTRLGSDNARSFFSEGSLFKSNSSNFSGLAGSKYSINFQSPSRMAPPETPPRK